MPVDYTYIVRNEANFRYQGANESFAKYYRDVSALFRFMDPPLPEDEKFFIIKKNMSQEYASIVASARPRTMAELVDICNGYDDTVLLQRRQRKLAIPYSALLEPNFATPNTQQRTLGANRFGRVNL